MAGASANISKGGAVVAVGGWAFSSEFFGLCGVLIAALGYLTSVYYQRRRDAREDERRREEREEHAARMRGVTR